MTYALLECERGILSAQEYVNRKENEKQVLLSQMLEAKHAEHQRKLRELKSIREAVINEAITIRSAANKKCQEGMEALMLQVERENQEREKAARRALIAPDCQSKDPVKGEPKQNAEATQFPSRTRRSGGIEQMQILQNPVCREKYFESKFTEVSDSCKW